MQGCTLVTSGHRREPSPNNCTPTSSEIAEGKGLDFVHFSYILVDMKETGSSTAAVITRRVLAARNRFFKVGDFGGSHSAVARTLSRLLNDGELVRVRRGLYWRGMKTPLGMSYPSAMATLEVVYGKASGFGPAHLDAANLLGLTTQVGARPTFAVPYEVDGLAMRLVIRSRRTGRALNRLTAYEVALLEVLGDWERVVDMPSTDAIARLASLVGRSIRIDAVVAAASTESARVRERLRLVLQTAGCIDAVKGVAPATQEGTRANALAGFSTS